MERRKVGTPICNDVTFASSKIVDVIPARWDGTLEKFVVATPASMQGNIIQFENGETVMLAVGCENKDALLDIL